MECKEILFEKRDGVARITINRPERYNAFTSLTLQEMVKALVDVWADKSIGVVVLTGSGDKAFCTGADIQTKLEAGAQKTGGATGFEYHSLLVYLIRAIPQPVIAMVNGYAIGGGHVLQVVCDMTIASENARFGQVGPRVGSFDAGLGTIFLARVIGEKRAREMWYMCRRYSAEEALEMGLVNKVVPQAELETEVEKWCQELLQKAPQSLAYLKASFNVDTDYATGIDAMAKQALSLYLSTDESLEGITAFMEKRAPDFSKFRV
jgi:naphthoate synthase